MAKGLREWVDQEVTPVKEKPLRWLAEEYFFRDPTRPALTDTSYFFSPADGVIVYQQAVMPDEPIVDIKGKSYSLRDAIRDPSYERESLVIGVFMTFVDVHINRIPYPGRLSYRELEEIGTHNQPMLGVEKGLFKDLRLDTGAAAYLHSNQRMLNRVYAPALGQSYFILQIADYDVNSIMPFQLKQNRPFAQNQRFSQIRYGSQVDLVIPLAERFEFIPVQQPGVHVEAGIDPLVRIHHRSSKEAP